MPRKQCPTQIITLFYPNLVNVNELKEYVLLKHTRIKPVNFFLLFNILSESYLELGIVDREEYVQIHSDILRCIFHNSYLEVIDDLVTAGYIEKNNSHLAGAFCKSYRINPKRMDCSQPLSHVEEPVTGYFKRKLTTLKQLNLCSDRADNNRQHVIDQTSNLIIVPDETATEYVRQRYKRERNNNPPEHYFTNFNNSPLKRTGIDTFGNRVHSVITNMPKALRSCLRFISAPTVAVRELDIVNSQPFFLSSVTGALIASFVPDASAAIPIFQKYENEPNFLEFKQLCVSGEIYEYLQNAYELRYQTICNGDAKAKRDFTKGLTYGVLFGDYDLKDANIDKPCKTWLAESKRKFYTMYKEEFPAVYSLFKDVKGIYLNCTVNKKGERKQYANNCLIAQRLESGIIFSHVVNACIENGYTELVTVHDCLLVREDETEQVRAILENEFDKLNLKPQIK